MEKYKAKLVVKGYHQIEGIDYIESFSLIMKLVIVKGFLILSTIKSWPIHQIDINNAYMNF